MTDHLLEVRDLSVEFHTAAGTVKAVQNVSWHLDRGETLAILGESGSGKSVSASAVMNLIDMPPGRITSGAILLNGRDMLAMTPEERRQINGCKIAMIFQDPLASLAWDEADFTAITRMICDAATSCSAPVVSVLEGGYDLAALGRSVRAHVEVLRETTA